MPTRRPPLTPQREGEKDLSDLERAHQLYRKFKRLEYVGLAALALGVGGICVLILFWDILLLPYMLPLIACSLIFSVLALKIGFERSSDILAGMVEGSERYRNWLFDEIARDLDDEEAQYFT